jgi:cyanophycin synthetase
VHDVPVALVTGSNGKTTVVRLLAAILAETGRTVGITSTDGAFIRGALVGEGDYSGPSGARLVLRRPEVEAAVLETARGGLLRRGLSLDRADVAVVTNVADDHLGEFGIQRLDELAQVKLLVTRAVGPGGAAVLNADDPLVVRHSSEVTARIVWFSLEPARDEISAHLAAGGRAVLYESGALALAEGPERTPVVRGEEMPAAMGGAARHNVANALAAIGAANAMGVPPEAMGRALRRFGLSPEDNVGRANLIELGGVRVLIDYAHNPHGMEALVRMSAALPAVRRLVLIGQAGDRSDESIRALARGALALKPDRVVLKEMERYLRGRAPGEVPAIMAEELERAGLPASAVSRAGTEVAAVVDALSWAHSGDLLLLTVHQDRPQVLALLERLRTAGWQAGEAVPG